MIIPNGIALIYEDKKTGDLIQQKSILAMRIVSRIRVKRVG